MFAQQVLLPLTAQSQQHEVCRGCPEYGTGPVVDEGEDSDDDDVVPAHAVVSVGKVDGGDGVGAAEGEKG